MEKINLLNLDDENVNQTIEIAKFGSDETAVVLFSPDGVKVNLHYLDSQEHRGYVRCNGAGCTLCRAGRKADVRIILPAFLPAAGMVGALLVSTVRTPHSLLPQLMNSLRSGRQEVNFVSRDGAKFTVTTRPLAEGEELGVSAIKAFLAKGEEGQVNLADLITTISNTDLAGIPEIARFLELKGAA